jgi:hypothetical protein
MVSLVMGSLFGHVMARLLDYEEVSFIGRASGVTPHYVTEDAGHASALADHRLLKRRDTGQQIPGRKLMGMGHSDAGTRLTW